MTDDIVARLRTFTDTLLLGDFQGLAATTESAADEIERLRKELAETRRQSAEDSRLADELGEQMSRLRQRVIRADAEVQFLRGKVSRLEETIAIGIGGDTMQGEMPSDAELAEMLTELAESYDSICEGEKATLIRQAATRIRDQRGTINTLRAEVIVLTEKVERRGVGS